MNYLRGHVIRAAAVSAVCLVLIAAEKFGGVTSNAKTSEINSCDVSSRNSLDTPGGRFNGKIVFSSDRHNGRGLSIWTMNPDGSNPTRLTDNKSRTDRLPNFVPVYDTSPVWSPDGTRIGFVGNRDYLFAVYVMDADGSNPRLVTDKVLNPGSLAWSPNGSKIALSGGIRVVPGSDKPSVHIYSLSIDGGEITKLTSEGTFNDSPSWSPDGKRIAFNSNRDPDGRSKIWVMDADASNQHKLTDIHDTSNPLFYGDGGPVWSPDGTKILFGSYRDFSGTRNCTIVNCAELFVMNSDGSNDVPLTNDPTRDGGLAARWSPDGSKIVAARSFGTVSDHASGISKPTGIIVMNADGSNPVTLSNRSEKMFIDGLADWQPI